MIQILLDDTFWSQTTSLQTSSLKFSIMTISLLKKLQLEMRFKIPLASM